MEIHNTHQKEKEEIAEQVNEFDLVEEEEDKE